MFVRNNIPCPNCGKTRYHDVFVDSEPMGDRYLVLRAECSECMAFTTRSVPVDHLGIALLEASKTFPSGKYGFVRNVRRWLPGRFQLIGIFSSGSKLNKEIVVRACDGTSESYGLLSQNVIDPNLAEHPVLRRILSYVLDTSGDYGLWHSSYSTSSVCL